MKFVEFKEHNDWEGETWRFWLQHDGNEKEIHQLTTILNEHDRLGDYYEVDLTPIDESDVDTLVKHSRSGYMSYENKVTGKFICPEFTEKDKENPDEWMSNNFYKGGIKAHFKEQA
jgi:hypothetical protein